MYVVFLFDPPHTYLIYIFWEAVNRIGFIPDFRPPSILTISLFNVTTLI